MKGASGQVLILIIALVVLYLSVSGRYKCLSLFATCVSSGSDACSCGGGASSGGSPIIVTPGNSGVNPTNAPIYDARDLIPSIKPI